jgi:hypothetical protein
MLGIDLGGRCTSCRATRRAIKTAIAMLGSSALTPEDEVDAQVVRSVQLLTGGDISLFVDTSCPSPVVCDFICHADVRHIRGLLIATLQRWHQLKGDMKG